MSLKRTLIFFSLSFKLFLNFPVTFNGAIKDMEKASQTLIQEESTSGETTGLEWGLKGGHVLLSLI